MGDEGLVNLREMLEGFVAKGGWQEKGPLAIAVQLTDRAKAVGLPFPESELLTDQGGQVKGIGGGYLKTILERHNIHRQLASEAGRTSRGSISNAKAYVEFLNDLNRRGLADLEIIEAFWIERVKDFFAKKPFVLVLDEALSLLSSIRHLFSQARTREAESTGSTIVGTLLQHLVGAKLELVTGKTIDRHGASVADANLDRAGDFESDRTVIHVTTSPGRPLLEKCQNNLSRGLRPWIVTLSDSLVKVTVFADENGLLDRIDYCDIEQFLCCNFLERGELTDKGRKGLAKDLFQKYNEIIDRCENDPGLKINLG